MAYSLPIISRQNDLWNKMLDLNKNNIIYQPDKINIHELSQKINNTEFVDVNPKSQITWEYYFDKNISTIQNVIKNGLS